MTRLEMRVSVVEQEEDKSSSQSYWGYIILFAVGVFLGYQFHHSTPEKVMDGASASLGYNSGYSDGVKFGELKERTKWCEPQQKLKPGDMSLDCLKLFLDGAGSSLMEKNGIKIETLLPHTSKKLSSSLLLLV